MAAEDGPHPNPTSSTIITMKPPMKPGEPRWVR
jgi:hypothetical protein